MNKYTLALISAADLTGYPMIDIFAVKKNDEQLFHVSFDYCDGKNGDTVARVTKLTTVDPSDLPRIYSGIHLIGIIDKMLCGILAKSDDEFYGDRFYAEDGSEIEHEIDFDALTA